MPRDELLETYYELFDIFESIEVLAMALKELQGVKMCRSAVIGHLEATRLYHFQVELTSLYEDIPLNELKAFKIKQLSFGTQLDIFDFIRDE